MLLNCCCFHIANFYLLRRMLSQTPTEQQVISFSSPMVMNQMLAANMPAVMPDFRIIHFFSWKGQDDRYPLEVIALCSHLILQASWYFQPDDSVL